MPMTEASRIASLHHTYRYRKATDGETCCRDCIRKNRDRWTGELYCREMKKVVLPGRTCARATTEWKDIYNAGD